MRGVFKLKGGLMIMIEYTNMLHRRSSAPTILQLVVCANMVSTLLGLFIFSTSCTCTSLPSPPAGKLQDKERFQFRRLAHINLSTTELLQETNSKSQNLDVMRNNIMGEMPRKLMQLRTREQEMRAQNAQIMGPLYHHDIKLTMKSPQPVYGKGARCSDRSRHRPKVSIKPAQLIHQGVHANGAAPPCEKLAMLYQLKAISRKPSQFNGTGHSYKDLEAVPTMKPALRLHNEEENLYLRHEGGATIFEVSSQSHAGAPLQSASLHDHIMKETIRPGAVLMRQLHEEFYRRGRSALQVELLERQKAMMMTRTRAHKELHRDHAGDQRAFHADYAEAHPHPPRNN